MWPVIALPPVFCLESGTEKLYWLLRERERERERLVIKTSGH